VPTTYEMCFSFQMIMSDTLEQKCILCKEPAEKSRAWDEVWDRKCADSICKLLERDRKDLAFLFENRNYCSSCHGFIRDIDFTVRTLESLQEKSQELRTILSRMLLPNFESQFQCDSEEDEHFILPDCFSDGNSDAGESGLDIRAHPVFDIEFKKGEGENSVKIRLKYTKLKC